MTVIEVEGINVQPLIVDSIQIFVGTRGSNAVVLFVLLITPNRSTLLSCCKMLFVTPAQDDVPYVFIGRCEPTS